MLKSFASSVLLALVPFFAQASETENVPAEESRLETFLGTDVLRYAFTHTSSYDFTVEELPDLEARIQQRMYCDLNGSCLFTKLRFLIKDRESENWTTCLQHSYTLAEDYLSEKALIKDLFLSGNKPLAGESYEDYGGYISLRPQWLSKGWRDPLNRPYSDSVTKSWPLFWSAVVSVQEDIFLSLMDECDLSDQEPMSVVSRDMEGWYMVPAINVRTGFIDPNIRFLSDFLGDHKNRSVLPIKAYSL